MADFNITAYLNRCINKKGFFLKKLLELLLAGSPPDREKKVHGKPLEKEQLCLWSQTVCESLDTAVLSWAWSMVSQGLSYCEKQINSVCLMYLHWKVF